VEADGGLPGHRDKTQKGTGSIVTTTSSVLVRMSTYDQTCWIPEAVSGGVTYTPTFPVLCAWQGLPGIF
jgi:hypothetical protein